jgi:CheY-like chemotaxis protein
MGATLLLADDSITIQRVIELTFADEDVRVIVAGDGQQAVQKIDAEAPDIVLADIGMPRMDGYDVASYVKRSPALRHIPVLLLTGAFEPIDEARARRTGCDGVLVKPFEPQTLVARVKELLSGARTAELWPAHMPRTQTPAPEPEPAAPPTAPSIVRVRRMPEVLRADQEQVPAPPLSVTPSAAPEPVNSVFDLSNVADAPVEPHWVPEGDDVGNRGGDFDLRQSRRELPPPADRLESELDMLDAALSRMDPTAHPGELD